MKPSSPYAFNKNSSAIRTPSPHLKGLKALRGSPKREQSRWDPLFRRLAARNKVLVSVWLLIFPFIIITLQWRIHRVENAAYAGLNNATSFLPPTATLGTAQIGFDENNDASTRPRIRSPSKTLSKEDGSRKNVKSFDPSIHHVIPSSVYEPKSSNPLQVMYIGRTRSESANDDAILDALERSRYTLVAATFLYKNTAFYEQMWHSFRPTQPAAVVVDWSALQRDCHVLHRILSYLNQHNNFLQNNKESYLLLLDSTASTRIVTCSENLSEIVPQERIRVAKRSVVEGRLWNYTKQWIEPGKLISNMDAGVLHATGSVGEDFVDQLRMIEGKNRSIDVSHFWQASSAGDSSQYYYSFLRRTLSSALHEIKNGIDENRDELTSTWLDRLGVGEEVDEMESSADENDDTAALNLHIALLAASKIVIVSQNDEWEDHDDRLMEALATGAMVLSDAMVAPPAGLRNKTNVVFYDSADSLQRLLQYYLDPKNSKKRETIARHGLEYALGRHRSWHVLESLLFGKALTQADKKPYDQEPPTKRKHSEDEAVVTVTL